MLIIASHADLTETVDMGHMHCEGRPLRPLQKCHARLHQTCLHLHHKLGKQMCKWHQLHHRTTASPPPGTASTHRPWHQQCMHAIHCTSQGSLLILQGAAPAVQFHTQALQHLGDQNKHSMASQNSQLACQTTSIMHRLCKASATMPCNQRTILCTATSQPRPHQYTMFITTQQQRSANPGSIQAQSRLKNTAIKQVQGAASDVHTTECCCHKLTGRCTRQSRHACACHLKRYSDIYLAAQTKPADTPSCPLQALHHSW